MEKDVLVILMIAFGIFAIAMFILFYVYLKKYYNGKHIEQDFENDIFKDDLDDDIISTNPDDNTFSSNDEIVSKDELFTPLIEDNNVLDNKNDEEDYTEDDFVPIKKK